MARLNALISVVVIGLLAACAGATSNQKPRGTTIQAEPTFADTDDRIGQQAEAQKARRRALVIGNGNYRDTSLHLDNPTNDARLMSRALSKIGIETSMQLNMDGAEGTERILSFLEASREPDLNIIYYAGHAFQINGENYLVPTDFDVLALANGDIAGMIRLSTLVEAVERSGASKTIIILDACRDNPLAEIDAANGLALPPPIPQDSSAEILFLYATAPGQVAKDRIRDGDRNSPFTRSLTSWITDKNLTFESVVQATIRDVSSETLGVQVPWQSSNFSTPVRLAAREAPKPIVLDGVPAGLAGSGELVLQPDIWSMIDQNADDSRKDASWKGVDDLRYVAVADTGSQANVLTCQGDGRRCNHQAIASDTVYRCEERSGEGCGLYGVILNGEFRRLWRGPVRRERGSRTEGLSIAIELQWEKVGQVTGQVDYNTDGLGAIELLMTQSGDRCAGAYRFSSGFNGGRFNGKCADGASFTGTFTRNSSETFYAEGSDSKGRSFNGVFSTFR